MSVKIIHICEDEKFINSAILQFEFCFPGCNTFHVVQSQIKPDFVHVKPQECVRPCTKQQLITIAETIEKSVIVVLHSLSVPFYDFVLELPKENPVVWFCFGFEVYNDKNYYKTQNLFDNITWAKFSDLEVSQKKRIKELIRPYYRLVNKRLPLSSQEYKRKVIKRIDFLGSSFKEEFDFVSKLIKEKKFFFDYWYYPIEQILNVSAPFNPLKKTILIGNSGTNTGNHLDVFDKIKKFNLIAEQIVVPLNYGDSSYIDIILNEGELNFSGKFLPLRKFISLQDYNTILEEVGVAIFNNRRQQAIGNTIALLWLGAKVFLSKQNSFYDFLKRTGIYIYCYETDLNEQSCNEFLSLEQVEHNKTILFSLLNQEKLAIELQNQIYRINA
jgi:hypothetical protein